MRYAIWDLETSSSDTFFGHILEAGGILVDDNFKELDRFNLRGRLPEGELFQSMALLVNRTSVKQLTQVNLGHYQLINELENIFKRWGQGGPTIFLGWSNIGPVPLLEIEGDWLFKMDLMMKCYVRNFLED